MIWQFGELGYDYSINTCSDGVTVSEDCRVAAKPVRWDYREMPARYRVYQVMSALSALKRDYPVFQTSDFNWDVWGFGKRLQLNGEDMNVVIAGNFQVTDLSMTPGFQHTGTWYDYFTGASLEVSDLDAAFDFGPGEYHLWTDVALDTPENILAIDEAQRPSDFLVVPNPSSSPLLTLGTPLKSTGHVAVFDLTGRRVASFECAVGRASIPLPATLPAGPYVVRLTHGNSSTSAYWLNRD
jgi:hypothetical protein